jgi:RNA polymerase sigma-70 factor (ECF subfamily)
MTTTSETLLDRLRRPGDEQAWRRFVELYTPLILRWAHAQGLAGGDAEDLVQDVLALLIRKLPEFQYDRQQSFRAWLRTVTVNRCHDFFRRRGRAPRTTDDGAIDVAAPEGDVLGEAEYRRHLVSRALDLMKGEFETTTWRACWECVVNDRAAADVAAELGISVNAVYIAKSRVLRRLRQALAGLLE